MYGRTYTVPGVPFKVCVSANEDMYLHAVPCQENAEQPFCVPRSHGCMHMPMTHAHWFFHNTPKGTPMKIQA